VTESRSTWEDQKFTAVFASVVDSPSIAHLIELLTLYFAPFSNWWVVVSPAGLVNFSPPGSFWPSRVQRPTEGNSLGDSGEIDIPESVARLFSKAIQAVDNHTIRIARTISATTITPKLNTRIRRSYHSTLLPGVSEIRLAAPVSPLAFTSQIFQFLLIASQN